MTGQPNPSTVSFQSTTTFNSTSPLGRRPQAPQKDYAAALSVLQSRYGSGGANVPSPKKDPSEKLPVSARPSPLVADPALTSEPSANMSQATLTDSLSFNSALDSGSSAGSSTAGESRRKSKAKKSILRSLFKGKTKEES